MFILDLFAVLWIRIWIRIRSDPKLFAGSGSGIINFGSGSDKLQFSVTKKNDIC